MSIKEINIEQQLDAEISRIFKSKNSFHQFTFEEEEITYSDFLADKMLIVFMIRKGIPYSLFDLIERSTPFSEKDWAILLDLSTKTLQRYKQSSRVFKPIQSEKIIEIAEVTHIGLDAFGEMKKFKLWLDTPNFALGNLKPKELLSDSYGKEMVLGELTRINHGILV